MLAGVSDFLTIRADEVSRRLHHVGSQPVLQPCRLITRSATQLFLAKFHYCDRTTSRPLRPNRPKFGAGLMPAPRTSRRISSSTAPRALAICTTCRPGQGSHCAPLPRANSLPFISQRKFCPSALKFRRWRLGGMSGSSAMMVPDVGAVMRSAICTSAGKFFDRFSPPVSIESIANIACSVPLMNHSLRAASICPPNLVRACTSPAGGEGARLGSVL